MDSEVLIDGYGIYFYGFRLQEHSVLDVNGVEIASFIKTYKFHEGYQYVVGVTPLIWANFILDDYKVTWQQYYEYQPNIVSHQILVGDPLPTGRTMLNCSGIYT